MHISLAQLELIVGSSQGPLGVAVTYGGDHIPKSPFSVAVAPTTDLSKISVTGLGESACPPPSPPPPLYSYS